MSGEYVPDDVEVTPAMIAAGKMAFYPNEVCGWLDEGDVLANVFRAMEMARLHPLLPTREDHQASPAPGA